MDLEKARINMKELLKDRYFQVLSVLCLIYVIYWVLYGNYQYSTFNDQWGDIGAFMYTMYQHIFCTNTVFGLQYLVFSNHVSPFLLLVLPFFAAYPSATILFTIQDIFLALTAIAVYFVCKDLLKSRRIGIVLAFAFLISPAVRGLTFFDFHEEAFVPLFYILSFYFFWKAERKYFVIAYSLMLSLFEPTIVIGLTLLLGLLLYELLYDRKTAADKAIYRKRIRLLAIGAAITILFGLFYLGLSSYLLNSYQSAPYSSVPPISRVIPYLSLQINALTNSTAVQSVPENQLYIDYYGPIGAAVEFLGFGITSVVSPALSLILLSPWLGEVFIVNNVSFALPEAEYLGFFAGASAVSAIIGLLIIKEKRTFLSPWINFGSKRFELVFLSYTLLSTIIISYVILGGTSTVQSVLLINQSGINYTQIDNAIATIPASASVMAQASMAPHLYSYCSLETPPIDTSSQRFSADTPTLFWFKPDYIILDKNLPYYDLAVNNGAGFEVFSYAKGNYTTEYNKSGIDILKKIG